MSLSDLAALGSFVSGVAVLVSLVYLGLQTRQNSKHTKALILQGRVERIVGHHISIANPDLVSAWIIENGGTATPEEIRHRQFWLQGMAYDFSWEDTFAQHESGLISEEQFADFRAHVAVILKAPALHHYFSERPLPPSGPTAFQRFLNALLSETKVAVRAG